MKTFKQILGMSQDELKEYLRKYLASKRYKVNSKYGYLYAKGDIPVLLVAHLDTVHTERINTIAKEEVLESNGDIKTRLSSPQGIGGDDRCGVWIIMNILQTHKPSVLFCEDEEIGCIGAKKFAKTEYIKNLDVNYMIELDRRGNNDAVFYSCDNKEFTKWIEENSGYKKAWGTRTDISELMPESKIAGVNFSCGYYKEHKKEEYIYVEEMDATTEMVRNLIDVKVDKSFEYIAAKTYYSNYGGYGYGYNNYDRYGYNYYGSSSYTPKTGELYQKGNAYDDDYWGDYWGDYCGYTKSKNTKKVDDYNVKLTVKIDESLVDFYGSEVKITGTTKPECWMNLFNEYDMLFRAAITDYSYE